jgi:DNA-binding response OmpR family regulator
MSAVLEPSPIATPLRALVVDDAPEITQMLEPVLRGEGFDTRSASTGEEAIAIARQFQPDIVVLDLVLPGVDGLEVCRQLRAFSDAYVVMLTSKDAEVDKVIGLATGADDYLAKPFSARELVARMRAMLRRPRTKLSAVSGGPKAFGPITIDTDAREVTVDAKVVELTRIEFELLATLCSRPKSVFSRAQLLELVWGPNWYGDTHVVDVHVSNLRSKLGDRGRTSRFVQTVRGIGFRLGDELAPVPSR